MDLVAAIPDSGCNCNTAHRDLAAKQHSILTLTQDGSSASRTLTGSGLGLFIHRSGRPDPMFLGKLYRVWPVAEREVLDIVLSVMRSD